jgi:hypothetical protein
MNTLMRINLEDVRDVLSLHPFMALTVAAVGISLIASGIVYLYYGETISYYYGRQRQTALTTLGPN